MTGKSGSPYPKSCLESMSVIKRINFQLHIHDLTHSPSNSILNLSQLQMDEP